MNTTQKGIILLLKSAITGEHYELPEGFLLDGEDSASIIKSHHLTPLIYIGALNCGYSNKLPVMNQLLASYYKYMIRSENQMYTVSKIFEAFENSGIDYMPTKGCNMKAIYPKPEMRIMGDVDIIIRKEDKQNVDKLLTDLGFTFVRDSSEQYNEYVWQCPTLYLELHFGIRSFYNESYYDDVFSKATMSNGHRYDFSIEDTFIYLFNHFARHYRGGGIGLRHVMDLYVYRRAFPQMDEEYIKHEMQILHLHEFYKNICRMLDVWFSEQKPDEVTEYLTMVIFSSGSWGTIDSHFWSSEVTAARETGTVTNARAKSIMRTLFPDMITMKSQYPFLQEKPYLLPVSWVMRGGAVLLFRRKNISNKVGQWKRINEDELTGRIEQFRFVGLDVDDKIGK